MSEIPLIEIPCPLCGSDQSDPVTCTIDYVYGVPGDYSFVSCAQCRHIYLNPRPADAALMLCYPRDYAPHTSGAGSTAIPAADSGQTRSRIRRLLGRIPLLKRCLFALGQQHATVIPPLEDRDQPRLLEVGCAHGGYLVAAATAGWQVEGIEPDETAAERARQRGFVVQTSTFTAAELSAGSRDAIVAWMVLEHVPDPVPFVREAFGVLSAGGSFCLSVPNGGGFERKMFGRYWLGYDAPRHLQVFTASRLTSLLAESGFTDIQVIHQSSMRYWWGSIAAWGIARKPAARWPQRWLGYFIDEPPRWMKLLALLPEKMLALLHLSGRITVVAKKPQ
jgi:2-polyprenyl-3-methyl-5-hydroxy-6-metoxy-1,4-benzoquinol methylase